MKQIRKRLTYSNLISTLCLFLLLGGGAAFAATGLGKNSVGTKQIKKGAVTGIKIKKGTITGTQINLAKLGTVPSATAAATATTAGTANTLAPMEATHLVGAPGQPSFLDGSSSFTAEGVPYKFQPVGFYKDHDGIVHLSGVAKVGKDSEPFLCLVFTLPPGFRPASGTAEAFSGYKKSSIGVFGSNSRSNNQDLSGDVVISFGEEGEPEPLSGITFRAEG